MLERCSYCGERLQEFGKYCGPFCRRAAEAMKDWTQPKIIKTAKKRVTRSERKSRKRRARAARTKNYIGCGDKKWQKLRYQALKEYGRTCMLCRTTEGAMHVDHIKPKSKYPELAYEYSNLQILCADCNVGKGADDETDYRPSSLLTSAKLMIS